MSKKAKKDKKFVDPYPPSPWLSAKQAAKYAGVCRDTIYDALRDGELIGLQRTAPNGRWRIHRDNVDRWLSGAKPVAHLRSA
jgi:excisionase family DNA binding protein